MHTSRISSRHLSEKWTTFYVEHNALSISKRHWNSSTARETKLIIQLYVMLIIKIHTHTHTNEIPRLTTFRIRNCNYINLEAIISPGTHLEFTDLIIEWEIGDVNITGAP